MQCCTVHKPSHLHAHAPKAPPDELSEDDRDMFEGETAADIDADRKSVV